MCGITGIISLGLNRFETRSIVKMTDEISHRGPDGQGFLITNSNDYCVKLKQERPDASIIAKEHVQQVAFGHRRLSIVDLSDSAGQPMTESTGRYWIVYNGEIYNHIAIRSELKNLGYAFNTDHSDTEVILNAYACWGVECLQKFNGMWAFSIWDTKENTFFFARDRAGKKPLYYTKYNDNFYFASELKSILANTEIPRTINEKAVYDYLTFMTVPAPNTIINAIFKIPAAHYLFFKPGEDALPVRYWTPFTTQPFFDDSEEKIVEGLREHLYEAAKLRMRADVEVGVLLSGGLDSSISLACASKFTDKPIKAFSVGFENKGQYKNEFEHARKVAKLFGADYHELTLTESDFLNFYSEMVYYQDEPIADTANIPIYFIAKAASRHGVKVLLGGEGSDELFIGYKLWKLARDFANVLEGKPGLSNIANLLHKHSPLKEKRLFYYSWYEKIRNNQPVFWGGTELRSENNKKSILTGDFKQRLNGYTSFNTVIDLFQLYSKNGFQDKYNWMTATDLQYRLPDFLLARLDRMLMAASVEGRNPFLDVNVMEYSMRIPPKMKTKNGQEKIILKKAFTGILPTDIIYRNKDSFTVPLKVLFTDQNFKERVNLAIRKFNTITNIFSEEYINRITLNSNSEEFWNISNLALWHEKYCQ